ncbi:hypothetical protein N9C10_02965 [Flavobacteriaceae bacterium]|nr:hypothetical protein [Flavobacteriaceae bacterium]
MSDDISEQFRTKMTEWVNLKKQLGEARKDMKLLNNKEKELKTYIMGFMSEKGIDNVNLKKGKVSLRATKKKQALTKDKVQTGLLKHFQGDEVQTETAMNCIIDNLEIKDSSVISLTGINTKKDN